jgi:hypothetical protein
MAIARGSSAAGWVALVLAARHSGGALGRDRRAIDPGQPPGAARMPLAMRKSGGNAPGNRPTKSYRLVGVWKGGGSNSPLEKDLRIPAIDRPAPGRKPTVW